MPHAPSKSSLMRGRRTQRVPPICRSKSNPRCFIVWNDCTTGVAIAHYTRLGLTLPDCIAHLGDHPSHRGQLIYTDPRLGIDYQQSFDDCPPPYCSNLDTIYAAPPASTWPGYIGASGIDEDGDQKITIWVNALPDRTPCGPMMEITAITTTLPDGPLLPDGARRWYAREDDGTVHGNTSNPNLQSTIIGQPGRVFALTGPDPFTLSITFANVLPYTPFP